MAYPFLVFLFIFRARRGKEEHERLRERYGYASCKRTVGPLVWLHAASVGELRAVVPLIESIERFGLNLVLTTGTVSSATIARDCISERTQHQYSPLDITCSISRFLDHWQPDLAVFTESEIWPTTIHKLAKRKIPQVLVNARISDRSNNRWMNCLTLANTIFSQFSQVIAQSEVDSERFCALGAPWVVVGGNLKNDVAIPVPNLHELKRYRTMIAERPTWIAVSTHQGEESCIAKVHHMLSQHAPGILTVLVPRHPNRSNEVEREMKKKGLRIVTRTSGHLIDHDTDILLGDTIGEMGFYLRLSEIAFMGKSLKLKAKGGQNPIEPALTGSAILSGRFVHNFQETYQKFLDSGGVRFVDDEKMLAEYVLHLLKNRSDLKLMQDSARKTVSTMKGALEYSIEMLDSYIRPLRLYASLQRSHHYHSKILSSKNTSH
ncbi:3-deoxy-D-manno-octulosonic acid transferase [Candidatus Endowatersipora endosymbiont of Watersipora subatra]|uniref:3-deoxy-D-manno-octulosonic acid transferase n=1 Tax=Candidatus Endowatersipora endosymbiont of Watersipora subatra TaxID=3077946 RepID=UPI00312C7BAB